MKIDMRGILAELLSFVTGAIALVAVLPMLNVVTVRMLQAGYLEGAGLSQSVRTMLGIVAVLVLAAGWLTLVLFASEYYRKGIKKGEVLIRFLRITSAQLLAVPVVVVLYQIAFPMGMIFIDWVLFSGGLFLGIAGLFACKWKERQRLPKRPAHQKQMLFNLRRR